MLLVIYGVKFFSFFRFKKGMKNSLSTFTGFLQSQARLSFLIYRLFTESSQAPFFLFTGFLQNQARPPFFQFTGFFTESSQAPFFQFTGFFTVSSQALFFDLHAGLLQSQARPPFSIYRLFTESSQALFFGGLLREWRRKNGQLSTQNAVARRAVQLSVYALFALLVISYVSPCFLPFSLKNRRYLFIYLFIYLLLHFSG